MPCTSSCSAALTTFNAAVVSKVNHFNAHALQNAPHDVDGCIVAVKQTRGGNEAYFVRWAVVGEGLVVCGQVGHGNGLWGLINTAIIY